MNRLQRFIELNSSGRTLLHEMVLARDTSQLQAVLANQVQYSIEPRHRSTMVLHDMIQMVSEFHTVINHLTLSKQTFFPKVEMGDIVMSMNELLANTGGLVNVMDVQRRTLLHYACLQGDGPMCQFLLDQRALPDIEDAFDADPLSYAAQSNDATCIQSLAAKVDLKRETCQTQTILHKYIMYPQVLIALLDCRHVHLNAGNSDGETPLMHAVRGNYTRSAKVLVDRGALQDAKNKLGQNLLHVSSQSVKIDTFAFLLQLTFCRSKSALNAQDSMGNSPLHLFARKGNLDACKRLAALGACLDVKNNRGERPSDSAQHIVVRDYLRRIHSRWRA